MKGVYDHLIVHCSATPVTLDVGSEWLDRVHRQQGWSACGYHIVITRSGEIQSSLTGHRTRKLGTTGSHVGGCGVGWNKRSLGVCLIGGVARDGKTPEENFTPAQYAALWQVITDCTTAFDIPMANVMGHRDLIKLTKAAPKACPCFNVSEFIAARQDKRVQDDTSQFAWDRTTHPPLGRDEKLRVHKTITVQNGDTLWRLSTTYGVPVTEIKKLNGLSHDIIMAGQQLKLLN